MFDGGAFEKGADSKMRKTIVFIDEDTLTKEEWEEIRSGQTEE